MFRPRTMTLAGATLATAAALAALTLAPHSATGASRLQASSKILNLAMQPQLMSNWCWAASSKMVMEFAGRNGNQDVTQCAQARLRIQQLNASVGNTDPPSDCCGDAADCNRTGWPLFDQFGFQSKNTAAETQSWLPWETIVTEIDAGRPICFAVKWLGEGERGGHMGVVYGYEETAEGGRLLRIMDPWPVPQPESDDPALRRGGTPWTLAFDDFIGTGDGSASSAGGGSAPAHWKSKHGHWRDYYEIQPKSLGGGPDGPGEGA